MVTVHWNTWKRPHVSLLRLDVGGFFYDGWHGHKDFWIDFAILGFGFGIVWEDPWK